MKWEEIKFNGKISDDCEDFIKELKISKSRLWLSEEHEADMIMKQI